MENKTALLEPLFERAEEFGKTSFELLKYKTLEKTADVTSIFASRGIFIIALSMFIALLNIGTALWLGDLLGKSYYGFFCVAGFYAILSSILYFFLHKRIKKYFSNSIIFQLFN